MRQNEEALGYLENAQVPCCIAYTTRHAHAQCCGHGLRQTFHLLVHRKLRILTKRELRIPAFYQKHLLATLSHACTHDGIDGTMNLARYVFCCAMGKIQRLLVFLFCTVYTLAIPLTPCFV
jgi:hypothetical protein